MGRKTSAELITQRRAIWDKHLSGLSILEISKDMNLTYKTIQDNLKAVVMELDVTRFVEVEMTKDLTRLENMFRIAYERATGVGGKTDGQEPDIAWMDTAIKILDRKAKLLGLDAAKKIDIYAMIETWARKEGLDPEDVITVIPNLLPNPIT